MAREILINADLPEKRVAIVEDGKLQEFYIEQPGERTIVGNIYKGKVESVVPSLNAAFVNIGLDKKGFLYLSETGLAAYEPTEEAKPAAPLKLKKGDDVLVQVVKEGFGTKGPRISGQIGIAGRYLVVAPQSNHGGISRRIDNDKERKRLREILLGLRTSKEIGFIVRTAAAGKSAKEIARDARFLLKLWSRIKKASAHRPAPSLVYEEYDLTLRVMRDSFTEEINEALIDTKPEYRRIQAFMRTFGRDLARRIHFYAGQDLFFDRNIERQIDRIFEKHVYLKSGGYIVIEPTEGLVVIDVNSGGFKKSLSPEEAAFRINAEAVSEIARQLRLRDLGGIIVVDFIDMEKESHRRQILNILNHHLSKDKAKYDCLGISKFGLVQLTRERIHETVQAQTYENCPYCQGKGRIRSALTVLFLAFRLLKRHLQQKHPERVELSLNPAVISLIAKYADSLHLLERKFRSKINLNSNPTQHLEEIKIQ